MLTSSNFKSYLDQFNKLIAEGEAMYKAIKVIPGEYYQPRSASFGEPPRQAPETYVFDEDSDWQKWQTNYKLLLDHVIPLTSSQRTLIEAYSSYRDLKNNLEIHLSNLKAVKEHYEKGWEHPAF